MEHYWVHFLVVYISLLLLYGATSLLFCCLTWKPLGCVGVAFSKHVVHIYSYVGGNDLRQHLEVCKLMD